MFLRKARLITEDFKKEFEFDIDKDTNGGLILKSAKFERIVIIASGSVKGKLQLFSRKVKVDFGIDETYSLIAELEFCLTNNDIVQIKNEWYLDEDAALNETDGIIHGKIILNDEDILVKFLIDFYY